MLNQSCFIIISNDDDLKLINAAIMETGLPYERVNATSIEFALEKLQSEPRYTPDFIFMDWNLPLLARVKANNHIQNTPVIIFKDNVTQEEIAEAKNAGVSNILLKTTHETALHPLVSKVLNRENPPFVLAFDGSDQMWNVR